MAGHPLSDGKLVMTMKLLIKSWRPWQGRDPPVPVPGRPGWNGDNVFITKDERSRLEMMMMIHGGRSGGNRSICPDTGV